MVGKKEIARRFNRHQLYNRDEARKQHQMQNVRNLIDDCPVAEWSTDVNDHWDMVRQHFQRRAKALFPCQKRQQRQMYFSSEA
jgi:hypothetical protein